MAPPNIRPKGDSREKNASNVPSLTELKALQKTKRECGKRIEELKYKLFQLTDKHMDQAIVILKKWTKA